MDVHGVNAFFHFVTNNGLNGVNSEINSFVVCVEEYGRLCACDSQEYRESKRNQCKSIYENFISKSDAFKSTFLSKTSNNRIAFYSDDGKILKSFSR